MSLEPNRAVHDHSIRIAGHVDSLSEKESEEYDHGKSAMRRFFDGTETVGDMSFLQKAFVRAISIAFVSMRVH